MVTFEWNEEKNEQLIKTRGVSFRDVVEAYDNGQTLSFEVNNSPHYKNQHLLIIKIHNYAYVVPFVFKDETTIFLKTIFPDRKKNKKYITHS